MKIGIVTFHRAHNCGAALQCVALVTILQRMGHDVKVIDCNDIGDGLCIHIERPYSIRSVLSFAKRMVREWGNVHRRRYRRFMNKYIPLLPSGVSGEIPAGLDCYVLGSDQVLNPSIISGNERAFLLSDLSDDNKKISYAASFGVSTLPENNRKIYADALRRFRLLSFREASALKICKNELDLDGEMHVVLDPTLLLDADDYRCFERKVDVDGEYVLVYTVGGAMSAVNVLANEIASRYGLKVVFATLIFNNPEPHWLAVSPGELLYLARNATYIVTTSFHGTAFSIINRKPFLTVMPDGQKVSGRITDLLEKLNLSKRIVCENTLPGGSTLDALLKIDYSATLPSLCELRMRSLGFLEEALS